MDKEVLIFLHMDDEHPGYIADYFLQRNIPRRIVRCYKGEPVPKLDDSIAGLVFMGGVMSVNDELPWIASEVNLIEAALHKGVPLLGHCLGGQLISKALRSEEHTSELQSRTNLVCRLLLEKKKDHTSEL